MVPEVTASDDERVVLKDGRALDPDAVICATGYRRGTDAFMGHLSPSSSRGSLYVYGMVSRPSLLGYLGRQSRPLARRIAGQLS